MSFLNQTSSKSHNTSCNLASSYLLFNSNKSSFVSVDSLLFSVPAPTHNYTPVWNNIHRIHLTKHLIFWVQKYAKCVMRKCRILLVYSKWSKNWVWMEWIETSHPQQKPYWWQSGIYVTKFSTFKMVTGNYNQRFSCTINLATVNVAAYYRCNLCFCTNYHLVYILLSDSSGQ